MIKRSVRKKSDKFGNQTAHSQEVGFDSSVFDDPVAEQTRWSGLVPGGSSSRAVKQVICAARGKIRYRPTPGYLIFMLLFTVAGPLTWLFLQSPLIASGNLISSGLSVTLGIFSLLFFVAGVFWLKFLLTEKYIDLHRRLLVIGRKQLPLDSLHAVQIVAEKVKVTRSTGDPFPTPRYYVSFELNLVSKDASRVNLMDHADYEDIRKSAKSLSKLLSLPLWDMVEKDERFELN